MPKIAVRVSYPKIGQHDWHDSLMLYAYVRVAEVAFYHPVEFLKKVDAESVVAPFGTLTLKVTTVHMAHARITEFKPLKG